MSTSNFKSFLFVIVSLFAIQFTAEANNGLCRQSLFSDFSLSTDWAHRLNRTSANENEYLKKKSDYTDQLIHRGFVSAGPLTLKKAISFLLKSHEALRGNGVPSQENRINEAIAKYNFRVENEIEFRKNYTDHIIGRGGSYWDSLLMSWSKEKYTPFYYASPGSFTNFFAIVPERGFGILVSGWAPKNAIDSVEMLQKYYVAHPHPNEKEIDVPILYDRELIEKITLWDYVRSGNYMVRSTTAMAIQINRTGFNKYRIDIGSVDANAPQSQIELLQIKISYDLKINSDGTYALEKK